MRLLSIFLPPELTIALVLLAVGLTDAIDEGLDPQTIIIGKGYSLLQSVEAQKPVGIITIHYPSSSCADSFDPDFWADYDRAIAKEWGILSQTMCLDGLTIFEKITLVKDLQNVGLNVITMVDDSAFLGSEFDGFARPSENFGVIDFNYHDSTISLSHETLHLALEEMGYPTSCYVDAVHENSYRFARYYDAIMIIKYFEC
jgi:hypothetical protein